MARLKGSLKTALVTGAGSGIGKAVALALVEDGYRVTVVGRRREKLKSLLEEASQLRIPEPQASRIYPPEETSLIRKPKDSVKRKRGSYKDSIYILPADVTQFPSIAAATDKTIKKWGRLDVVFHSAGVFTEGNWQLDSKKFREILETNVLGTFHCAKAVIPQFRKQKSGYFMAVASRRGKIATPAEGAYATSKFAVSGFMEALYKELTPQGIKVTCICPGWVNTRMGDGAGLPVKEMLQPRDIVVTVRYLLKLSPAVAVKEVFMEPRKNISP